MQQITQIAILMIAVILMQTLTTAKIAFAMKIWIATVHLNWLEMATATMKPTMQNAILMGVTVVGPVLIWSNALIVGVSLDYLCKLTNRESSFFFDKPILKCGTFE